LKEENITEKWERNKEDGEEIKKNTKNVIQGKRRDRRKKC
jgi:hypothetical protein